MNIKVISWDRSLDYPEECAVILEVAHGPTYGFIRGEITLGISSTDLDRLEQMEAAVRTAVELLSKKEGKSFPCPHAMATAKEEGEL